MTSPASEPSPGGLGVPESAPDQQAIEREHALKALGSHLDATVVSVEAKTPFREFANGKQVDGAMEVICTYQRNAELGSCALLFQGEDQPADERTRTYLGYLAAADWKRVAAIRRDYGGNHYKLIHPDYYYATAKTNQNPQA